VPEVGDASEASIHTSVAFLQDTLTGMGLSDELNLMSSNPADVATTCNTLYALMLQHQKDAQYKEQLRQEMSRARSEMKIMDKERSKLETMLDNKDREIGALSNRARAGDDARKEEVSKARREADDLQKRFLGSERRLVQMQHEIKRKEKDYQRLQERLSHYLADKKRNESAALDMAGKLATGASAVGGAALSKSAVRSDEGLKAIVAAYEGKQSELARENKDLRAALSSLQGEYKEALNATMARREADAVAGPVVEESFLRQVPTMNADELRAELAVKLKVLQRRLSNLSWRGPAEGKDYGSVAEQRSANDLAIAKSVIQDQEQLIACVLGALRSAQVAQEAKYQSEIKALVQRYQGQLASAEAALAQAEGEAAQGEKAARALEETRRAYEEVLVQRDDALRRVEECEDELHTAEAEYSRALKDATTKAESSVAAALAAARAEVEGEMTRVASESTELHLNLKREQASLRAETGALRERLVAEKAASSKSAAERDQVIATLETQIQEAERRGAARSKVEMQSALAAKEAELAAIAMKIKYAEEAMTAAEQKTEQIRVQLEKEVAAKVAQQEQCDAVRAVEAAQATALAAAEMRLAEAIRESSRDREALSRNLDSVRTDSEREISALNEKLIAARTAASQREAALKESLQQQHEEELALLRKGMGQDRATLLAKAESDFIEEREILSERAAQLQAQLDAERCALKGREDQLRNEARKVAEAAESARKYDEMAKHYKDLMGKYAPGMGAGIFLERAVGRRAEEMAAASKRGLRA
jgi:X breakpoint 2-interacting protein